MNNEQQRAAIPIETMGGLIVESSPSDIPEGGSPLTWDTDYYIGSVFSRDGLQSALSVNGSLDFNYVKSFVPTNGEIKTLALDDNGVLYIEDVVGSEGTLNQFFTVAPGSFAKSVTQFEREWVVFSDLTQGTDVPRQYNGTGNFDRISQCGPGAPPSLSTSTNSYTIATITQPPIGPVRSAGKFQFVNWADSATGRQPGNQLTIFYDQDPHYGGHGVNPDLKPGVIVELVGLTTEKVFPAGTYVITSIGFDKPASDAASSRYWFAVQTESTGNVHTRNGPDTETGTYEITKATVTTSDPIPGVAVGSKVAISGASVPAWDGAWTVTGTLNSGQYFITQTQIVSGVAIYGFTVITGVPPTIGEQVSVSGCNNGPSVGGNSILNVLNAIVTDVTGTLSSGTFSVSIVADDVSVVAETGAAITSGNVFTIDPGLSHLGAASNIGYVSPIFGASTGGSITVGGDLVAGVRQAVTIFKTRTGYLTAPSAPAVIATPGGNKLTISNIAIGPPNVIARIIGLTGADGGQFFWIPNPVTVTGVGQTKTYDASIINDNTTTTVDLDFTDEILLASLAIDVQGENLFNLCELGNSVWNVAYADRIFYGLEDNKLQNLVNTTFDGGYLLTNPNLPGGWTAEPHYQNGGTLTVSPIFGNSYTITQNTNLDITSWAINGSNVATFTSPGTVSPPTGTGFNFVVGEVVQLSGFPTATFLNGQVVTVSAIAIDGQTFSATVAVGHSSSSGTDDGVVSDHYIGWISQLAFQDYFQVPIITTAKTYSARITVRKTSDFSTGAFQLTLTSPQLGVTYGTANVNTSAMTQTMVQYNVSLMTTAFTVSVPKDLQLNLFAVGLPVGDAIEIDRFEIYPDDEPQLSTEVQGSYVIDPESFDGVTGRIGLAQQNNQPVLGAFVQYDLLYFLKSNSMFSTSDVPRSEPSGWTVKEVSNKVGTAGPLSYDSGEEWMITACRPGLYLFAGNEPIKLSQEVQPLWDALNWKYGHTIWVKNDILNRRVMVGVPLPTPNQWLPNDETNANPTEPNVVLMVNYRELNTALSLAEHPPIHVAYSGKLISWDQSRKWSIWHIKSPYADFITRDDLERPLFVCGYGTSKIYQFIIGSHDDDGAAINSLYTTFGFVQPEQENQSPLLGNFRKLYNYLDMNIRGAGRAIVRALPNIIDPRNPYIVPGGAFLVDDNSNDLFNAPNIERPLNVTANRCYIQIETQGAGNWFQLSKMVVVAVKDPWSPVRGVQRPSGIVVSITPSSWSMAHSTTKQFTTSLTGTTNLNVTWSVVGSGHGTITAAGLYTAPSTPGSYTIKATSVADPLKTKTAIVTVT